MDANATKDLLHLRIEQADEKLLAVLAELTESLFRSYQPGVVEEADFVPSDQEEADKMEAYEATLKPMSKAELYVKINEALAEYERGERFTLGEVEQDTAARQGNRFGYCSQRPPAVTWIG